MKWLHSARARLHLLFARRAAESRMNDEFLFHIEMETDRLVRANRLAPDEARRRALAAFGGVEKHKEAMRDGRGLAWLSGLSLDLKLGGRMLFKYPGLTLAGGLALAIAIGIGAGWYDVMGKILTPTIPLPEGDRLVSIETQNTLTNAPEPRVVRDFLEWRRELRTLEDLGAYRADSRNLMIGNSTRSRWRSSPPPRSVPHVRRPGSVAPCSTPTRHQERHPWSWLATTCGSAPSAPATTSSDRS
jgi:putative ABC transport system permease protein